MRANSNGLHGLRLLLCVCLLGCAGTPVLAHGHGSHGGEAQRPLEPGVRSTEELERKWGYEVSLYLVFLFAWFLFGVAGCWGPGVGRWCVCLLMCVEG